MNVLKLFLLTVPVFLVMDMAWLGFIAKSFYHNEMGTMMAAKTNWYAAALVYVVIPLGIILFVIPRVDPTNKILSSLGWGALFGLVLYGTYEFTNLALVKDWPVKMAIVDVIWGCVICGVTSMASYLISTHL